MADIAVIALDIANPDPYDQIRIACRLVADGEGASSGVGYTFDTYVAFDASDEDINAAVVAAAVTAAGNHSITVDNVRLIGGAFPRIG